MTAIDLDSPLFRRGNRDDDSRLVDTLQRRAEGRLSFEFPGWARRLAGPVLLLALWQLAVSATSVDPELVPGPIDVVHAGIDLASSGQLGSNFLTSLTRVLFGLSIGLFVGTTTAVLAGLWQRSGDVVDSAMQVLKAIPVFALLPLFIVWTGIGEAPKIALIAVSTALPIYINTYGSIRNVDNELAEVARVLGLKSWGTVRHLLLPGSLTGFLSGLRISLTSAWLALIFAETVNATSGLGFLMYQAQMAFRMDIILLVICVYAVAGITGYALLLLTEGFVVPWRRRYAGI